MCKHIKALSKAQMAAELKQIQNAGPVAAKLLASLGAIAETGLITGYRVEYGYGDLIINNGLFALPGAAGQPTPCVECQAFQEKHSYTKENPVPLLLNITRDLEIFRIVTDVHVGKIKKEDEQGHESRRAGGTPTWLLPRTVPVVYRQRGELIGLFEALRQLRRQSPYYGKFYVSAGSRNVHLLLPLTRGQIVETLESVGVSIRDKYARRDLDQYGIALQKGAARPPGITADWLVLRKMAEKVGSQWKASLLLLLPSILGAEPLKDEQRELHREILGAAFDQLQDSLLALTASDQGSLHESYHFKNLDSTCLPAFLAHLKACTEGRALLHRAAHEKDDAKGPWSDALKWVAEQDDYEVRDLEYPAVILEPRQLMTSRDVGCVSFTHPLVSQGLRFLERDHPKVPGQDKRIFETHLKELEPYIVLEQSDAAEFPPWARKHADDWPRGACLKDFLVLRHIQNVSTDAASPAEKY